MTRLVLGLVAASIAAALAFSPRLDALSDTSFAWHMVQHLLLIFVVPFFVLAAQPFRLIPVFGSKRFTRGVVRVSRALERAAHPAAALGVFIATLWLTHFSGLYEFALTHLWAHIAEHVLYLAAGTLFWIPVLAPPPVRPLPFPVRLLYLMIALPQGALLAFALAASRHPLYAHYASNPGALTDQSNAAAVMWIGGGLVIFTAFLGTFGAWALRESIAAQPHPGGRPL